MQIRAVIVDDELTSRNVLKKLLKKFCPNIELVGEADTSSKAHELINKVEPDIVFLDIQMPGGSGFSLLKKVFKTGFDVVFVTGYDEYALEAIRLSALHYLVKPIEVEDLKEAVKRIEISIQRKEFLLRLENAEYNLKTDNRKIIVHTKDQVFFIPLNLITHLVGERNYTIIYTKDSKYISSKNLGEYENILKRNEAFLRIGKSCIVNISYITNYSKGESCMLVVNGVHAYEISRRKKQEVLNRLKLG